MTKNLFKTLTTIISIIVLSLLPSLAAHAHPSDASSLTITVKEKTVEMQTIIPLEEFNAAAGTNITNTIDAQNSAEAEKYLLKHIEVKEAENVLPSEVIEISVNSDRSQKDLTATIIAVSEKPIENELYFKDDAVIENSRNHAVYLYLISDWASGNLSHDEPISLTVLSNSNTVYLLDRAEPSFAAGFMTSIQLGFTHIVEGYDHMLFLMMLLVPAPLIAGIVAGKRKWSGLRTWKETLKQTLFIVTAFTLGHSISLIIVTLTNANYNSFIVELIVALSVGLAAVNVIKPLIKRGEIWIAGIFGLVHGTAFAGTLQHLNLETWPLVQALVAFNVGIELAQIAIVFLILPIFWLASRWKHYNVVRIILAVFALIACAYWVSTLF